jgi:hypothetical protein
MSRPPTSQESFNLKPGKESKATRQSYHEELRKILRDTKRGKAVDVPKDSLLSDTTYQRIYTQERIIRIVRTEFSWVLFGCLTVCRRTNGTLFLVDGQSRVTGVSTMPEITTLPCQVFEISDERAEALAFLMLQQNRAHVNSVDQYRARVQAMEPDAVFIAKLLEASGVQISVSSARLKLNCPWLLMGWAGSLRKELTALWPMFANWSREQSLHSNLLRTMMYVERRMPAGESLADKKWSARLNEIGPARLTKATARYVSPGSKGETSWVTGVLEEMNKGLRNKLRIRASINEE